MDTEEQPYDDRHGPRPKAVDPLGMQFRLSIPDAIDAVRDYRQSKRMALPPRTMVALDVVTDELEARFNAEQRQAVDREVGGDDLQSAIDHLADVIDTGQGSTSTLDAASVVLFALRQRMDADIDPPVPGTPLDTQSGLRYIAPGGTFAAYWTGEGNGPQLAQTSLLALRVLSAHLTTALDHVTGELELRRH